MKYYVFYKEKNNMKEFNHLGNVSNLIRTKLDIECLYKRGNRELDIKNITEWKIYDEYTNLIEIGIVESTVKGKEITWFIRG